MSEVLEGDCVEVMAGLEECSVSAIVTDPPYGIRFMGKAWDGADIERDYAAKRARTVVPTDRGRTKSAFTNEAGSAGAYRFDLTGNGSFQAWCETWAREALRVAKPGAHLLAFGGTRTYHRLVCAIEDAGWEIRDCLVWAYASGFPKSLNLPGGLGTALKPAWEPIVLARKPLRGTVAANMGSYGTGALNIDGTRIPFVSSSDAAAAAAAAIGFSDSPGPFVSGQPRDAYVEAIPTSLGRWPANVILTDPIFDGDTPGVVGGGEATTGGSINGRPVTGYNKGWADERVFEGYDDSGTYSRFFLIPKADRADREPVLGGLPLRNVPNYQPTVTVCECGERWKPPENGGRLACNHPREMYHYESAPRDPRARANHHPTVKPVELMRHLVRLVTPPGGTVLDPFLGSGTTAIAAEMEGFPWIGIEKEPEYVAIARARLNGTQRGLGLVG